MDPVKAAQAAAEADWVDVMDTLPPAHIAGAHVAVGNLRSIGSRDSKSVSLNRKGGKILKCVKNSMYKHQDRQINAPVATITSLFSESDP